MKAKPNYFLILLVFLMSSINIQASETFLKKTNNHSLQGTHEFSTKTLPFADCPTDVANNVISTTDPTNICGEGSVSFTGSTPGIKLDADTTIQWQSKILNGNWTDIPNANVIDYTTGTLTETTSFRRLVVITGCSDFPTNEITVTVNPIPDAPTGDATQTFCSSENPTTDILNVTGSNIAWYSDANATNPVQSSEVLTDGTTYYATQTVDGCESATFAVTAVVYSTPTLSATKNDPASCGGQGSIDFTFTNVPEGPQTVYYNGGTQTLNVNVSATGTASVPVYAGTYENLTISIKGCTSTENVTITISDPNPPSAPTGNQNQTFCAYDTPAVGDLVVTGNNITWYSDPAGTSIVQTTDALIDGNTYYATQNVDGCESATFAVTAAVIPTPAIVVSSTTNPVTCNGQGTIQLSFTNVPDENYTIYYDGGSFTNVAVSGGEATISADAGIYDNLTLSVSGCTSANGVSATLTAPTPPDAPTGDATQTFCSSENPTTDILNVTGSNISWYSDANATNPVQSSEVLTDGTTYYATQTVDGCESTTFAVTVEILTTPVITNVTEIDPSICQGQGSLNFTFSGVPNGTYDIAYDGNSFKNVTVSGNFASVPAYAGTYSNLRITANGCTSANGITASLSDPNPPATPTILVQDNCGESVLTAYNYTGTLTWSTDEQTQSIVVNAAGDYSVTQTLNGCTSNAATATATPKIIPAITNITENNPTACQGDGSLEFTFTGVTDGTYSISYDGGSFSGVSVVANKATVQAPSGTYSNLKISIDGCASASGVNAKLTDPDPPSVPIVTVEDNCGESVLTASNYSGTLLWSTDDDTESIIVSAAGNYSVTQTVNGCTSDAATVTATPKTIPAITNVSENNPTACQGQGSLDFTFSGVPDDTYTIAYDGNSFAGVVVSGNKASVQASAGTYNNLRISVNGCTSANEVNASLSDPNPPSTPTITVQDNCGESLLTASNYTGTLLWSTGENTESIIVNTAGNYSLTQLVDGCTSNAATATATTKIIPAITNITENNPTACQGLGLLEFTFTGVPNGTYSIVSDDSTFTDVVVTENAATVQAPAGTYNNLAITVNGCNSANGVNASLSDPNPPPAPIVSVQNNCGESVLTASNYSGTLLWNTGESTQSIIVEGLGNYAVTQTVNGCISDAASAIANPKTIPSISRVTENDPTICQGRGSLEFTFSNVPNGTYTIAYDGYRFSGVTVAGNKATVQAGAGMYNNLRISVDGCSSPNGVNASLSDPNPPPAPDIAVENKCGESVLTASNYSGTLLWSTGETTESITVTAPGNYSLTQNVNGCTSDAASAVATPETSSLQPDIDVTNDCGESKITVNNLTENAWLYWRFNNELDSIQSNTITVNENGDYTVYQKLGNCSSLTADVTVSPLTIPPAPTGIDKEICATIPIQPIIAEATTGESFTDVLWYDAATGGNEILLPMLDTTGSKTYYAEAQNTITGCVSKNRTPVSLTIKPNPKETLIDTTIIGKPRAHVAVIIFPDDSLQYQWYLNSTEITNATKQYYYLKESERQKGNIFTIEVELQNGCKAKFNYTYAGTALDNELNAFKSTGISDIDKSFLIYPNPVNNNLYIAVNAKEFNDVEKLNAKIYSVTGACIIETRLDQNPKSIDTRDLRPGFYSVVIYSAQKRLTSKKLVVTKH